jgi:hypothetical protein
MKKALIALGFIACFVGGAISQRIYFGTCIADAAAKLQEGRTEFMHTFAPLAEAERVAALRATIDTLWAVRSLDAEDASEEARISSYSEELIVRMGDVRQTLNNTGQYGNEYAVNHAFERANKMLQEMGETTQLEPYF